MKTVFHYTGPDPRAHLSSDRVKAPRPADTTVYEFLACMAGTFFLASADYSWSGKQSALDRDFRRELLPP